MMDLRSLLQDAKFEISSLRRANEIMAAKIEMIELMRDMLGARLSQRSMVMGEDILRHIEEAITGMNDAEGVKVKEAEEQRRKRESEHG